VLAGNTTDVAGDMLCEGNLDVEAEDLLSPSTWRWCVVAVAKVAGRFDGPVGVGSREETMQAFLTVK
jgi:hypothetical protein